MQIIRICQALLRTICNYMPIRGIERRRYREDEMNAPPDDIDGMLRDAGMRVTHQRRTIILTLAQSLDHPSAEDVFARAKGVDTSVSFATVYRTLGALADAGIVQRVAVDDGPARFEMASETDHDHLVDVDTGEVLELASDELTALRSRLAKELGYEVLSQHSVMRVRKTQTS